MFVTGIARLYFVVNCPEIIFLLFVFFLFFLSVFSFLIQLTYQ